MRKSIRLGKGPPGSRPYVSISVDIQEKTEMNWDDPAARLALIEQVGVAEYNRLHEVHRAEQVIETVNGHELRSVSSRFGRLVMVGDTGKAFQTIEQARAFAKGETT